jgi:hypothetical protein
MPKIKASRQKSSKDELGGNKPARIPLTPIIRPFVSIKKRAAAPISAPPLKDISGVNSAQFIVIYFPLIPDIGTFR